MLLRHQAWIVLVAGVVFFTGLGGPRLWEDDEAKNARCAQEMMDRGDWFVPMFNASLRPDKPVLFYWLAMASYQLLGTTELAARFPSALLAIGTALATYHLGRRLFRPQVGLWAGLAMATNIMFATVAHAATPDSTLIFCTTAALLAYVVGMGSESWSAPPAAIDRTPGAGGSRLQAFVPRSWCSFALMYAAMGLAMLDKGPVGVVLPVMAIGCFVLFEKSRLRWQSRGTLANGTGAPDVVPTRPEFITLGGQLRYHLRVIFWRLRCLAKDFPAAFVAMRPLTLIVTVLVVAGPWYAWVGIRTHGEWWKGFFWEHNVQRFMEAREGHHGLLLFPPVAVMACFFPWSLFLSVALAGAIRRIRRSDTDAAACRLAVCWSAVWIVFFSICGTKQPNYILPAYPMLAVLVGLWISDWVAAPQQVLGRRLLPLVWWTIGVAGVGFAIALTVLSWSLPRIGNFSWLGLIPIAGALCGWFFQSRHSPSRAVASLAIASALLLAALLGDVAVPVSREQNGFRLSTMVGQLRDAPSRLGQFRLAVVGLVYYADRKVDELATAKQAAELFANGEDSVVVTDPEGFKQLDALLPGELQMIDRTARFCKRGDMVLVVRSPTTVAGAGSARAPAAIADKISPTTRWK